jgi:hypothetical protein
MRRYLKPALILLATYSAACATALPDAHLNADPSIGVLSKAPSVIRAVRARETLTINVSHHVIAEPAQVTAYVRVEPDARSRSLSIEWWALDTLAGGSHLITLEGDRSAAHYSYPIKRMEAGEYEVVAILTRDDGSQVKKQTKVIVTGEGTTFSINSF